MTVRPYARIQPVPGRQSPTSVVRVTTILAAVGVFHRCAERQFRPAGGRCRLRRMVRLSEGRHAHRHRSTIRRIKSVTVEEIISATAKAHRVESSEYARFRSAAAGRDMAAWLCRRWSGATLRELGPWFGLAGTDSVSNLVRRAEGRYKESSKWRRQAKQIETKLGLNTEHKAFAYMDLPRGK